MNINEAAMALDGNKYGRVGSKELFTSMASAGLVAIHGYSDDVILTDGAVSDEAYGEVYFGGKEIEAKWDDNDVGASWTYETDIPHKTFKVMEGGDLYCLGIVIDLNNLEKAK